MKLKDIAENLRGIVDNPTVSLEEKETVRYIYSAMEHAETDLEIIRNNISEEDYKKLLHLNGPKFKVVEICWGGGNW